MPFLTNNLKVKFLGIIPVLTEKKGVLPASSGDEWLNPQQIVSLSSLATFKGKAIKKLLKEIEKSGKSLDERTKKILQNSSLRGHASLATTPSLCFSFEGSKFLDSAISGIVFSSSLMSSGRRTKTTEKDIIFPQKIFLNKKAKKIYQETSERIIKFVNFLLSQGIQKDEASKILQYGIYGTGIIQLPIESIVGLKREYLAEKEWMPEEIGILLKKIEKKTGKLGIDLLYASREIAPRNVYPYPNIFKDPQKSNLVRTVRKNKKLSDGAEIVSIDVVSSPGLEKNLKDLEKKKKKVFSSLKQIKKEWPSLLSKQQEILRDYNLAIKIKVLSSVPWRVWGEKKRHRTCPQIIESIYYCIDRTAQKFSKFKKEIEEKRINQNLVREIEEVFSIPPSIKRNQEFLSEYLQTALKAFEDYEKLIKLKVKPRDAIFLIPRGVKIDILQEYDLYNLLTGYYPLRLCQTAEAEMRTNTQKETVQIKKALSEKGYGWLNKFIGPKCQTVGFCPEEKYCAMISSVVKNYNEKFHREMKEDLQRKFQENLKTLGCL